MLKSIKNIFVTALIAVSSIFTINTASAAIVNPSSVDKTNPQAVVNAAVDNTFAILGNYKGQIKSSNTSLRNDIKANVLPFFNTKYIAYTVLSTYARTAKADELKEFHSAIEEYMVNAYIEGLSFYTNQTVKIGNTTLQQNYANTVVTLNNNGTNIDINFRLVKLSAGTYGIIDFTAEGISLINTKATEWNPILRNSGVTGLTKYIKEHMNNILGAYKK